MPPKPVKSPKAKAEEPVIVQSEVRGSDPADPDAHLLPSSPIAAKPKKYKQKRVKVAEAVDPNRGNPRADFLSQGGDPQHKGI
jgi:hypothetical protein